MSGVLSEWRRAAIQLKKKCSPTKNHDTIINDRHVFPGCLTNAQHRYDTTSLTFGVVIRHEGYTTCQHYNNIQAGDE